MKDPRTHLACIAFLRMSFSIILINNYNIKPGWALASLQAQRIPVPSTFACLTALESAVLSCSQVSLPQVSHSLCHFATYSVYRGSLLIISSRFRVVELAHDFKLRVELLADVRLEVLLLLGKLGLRDNLLLHFPLLERAHLGLLVLAYVAGHSLQLFLCQFFCILLLLLFSSFFVHRLLDLFPNSALEVLERLTRFLNFPGLAFFDERIG